MVEATFEQAYPIALRAAQVRAAAAVVSGVIPMADREDFEQEGLTACWRALPHFDPARASLRTFIERVISARLASVIRSVRRAPLFTPIKSAATMHAAGSVSDYVLNADLERLLTMLCHADRQLALLLVDHSPAEVGRLLGMPRSTVHDRIVRLRRCFVGAGFAQKQPLQERSEAVSTRARALEPEGQGA
jgi:RNA polymerase sigma factor (sigma-70 family)